MEVSKSDREMASEKSAQIRRSPWKFLGSVLFVVALALWVVKIVWG